MPINITTPGVFDNQAANLNFLSPLGFRFTLKRSPKVNFFVTDINIPSLNLGFVNVPSPFKIVEIPGDKPDFGNLRVTFKVDENMENYLEIFNWLIKLGFPEDFTQYAAIAGSATGSGEGTVADATLTILNSSQSPNLEVQFEGLFPIGISEVNMTTADIDVNYVTATAEFKFNLMKVVKLAV